MLLKKIIDKISYFIKSKKIFSKPKKMDLLVYDNYGNDFKLLKKNLKKIKFESIDVRQKELNLYIFFLTILNFNLKISFFENYIFNYINYVNPKIILTIVDTNPLFFLIKKKFPNIKTIVVQTAYRSPDFIKNYDLKNSQIDYALTFGDSIGLVYKKYFKAKNFTIGSFKNNNFKKKKNKKNYLIHISSYSTRMNILKDKFDLKINFNRIKHEKFFLNILANFCKKNKLKLYILPKTSWEIEEKYYKHILKSHKFNFLRKKHQYSSYYNIDDAKYITSINSSLGLEAFARGLKVGFINIHRKFNYSFVSDILWPSKIKKKGPFWTNENSKKEILRVLNYLILTDKKKWKKNYNLFVPLLVSYDYKNLKFKKILFNLLKKRG